MTKTTSRILGLLSLALLCACDGLQSKHLLYNYYLVSVDGEKFPSLSYRVQEDDLVFVSVIDGPISEIVFNEEYIVARSYVPGGGAYYIIPAYRTFTYFPEKGFIGPLSKTQLNSTMEEMDIRMGGLSKIDFP